MKCIICKKKFDTTKSNYGWHINKDGSIEKCSFQNMPMQYYIRINPDKLKPQLKLKKHRFKTLKKGEKMGVRILYDKDQDYACLYCSTTMWAFGGIFYGQEEAEQFLEWLRKDLADEDPRILTDKEFNNALNEFRKERRVK